MADRGLTYLCSIVGALALISTRVAAADDLTGQASIIDGDTLEIHGTRIRLWGRKQSALSRRGQLAVSVRSASGERSQRIYRPATDKLHSDLAGSVRANRGDMFGRRRGPRGMAGPQRSCP